MALSSFIIFSLTYLLVVASPGPGVLALTSKILAQGSKNIYSYILGFIIGDLFWFTLTISGLAILAEKFSFIFISIKYLGVIYLIFLAYQFWNQEEKEFIIPNQTINSSCLRLFLSGLSITLGNPKAIIFFTAIVPSLVDLKSITLINYLEICIIIFSILSLVLGAYSIIAVQISKFILSNNYKKIIGRCSSVLILISAISIIYLN